MKQFYFCNRSCDLGDACRNLKALSKNLVLRIESGDDSVVASNWGANLLVASSWQVSELVQRGMALASQASGSAKPLSEKRQPLSLDYFGWCTWDAFYSSVSAMVRSHNTKNKIMLVNRHAITSEYDTSNAYLALEHGNDIGSSVVLHA